MQQNSWPVSLELGASLSPRFCAILGSSKWDRCAWFSHPLSFSSVLLFYLLTLLLKMNGDCDSLVTLLLVKDESWICKKSSIFWCIWLSLKMHRNFEFVNSSIWILWTPCKERESVTGFDEHLARKENQFFGSILVCSIQPLLFSWLCMLMWEGRIIFIAMLLCTMDELDRNQSCWSKILHLELL